jgi:hypothetical protein
MKSFYIFIRIEVKENERRNRQLQAEQPATADTTLADNQKPKRKTFIIEIYI